MKKFLIYAGVILAILLITYFGVSYWLVASSAARVADRRAEVVASGDKLYLTDYATDPIPEEDNAYHYLMLAKSDLGLF